MSTINEESATSSVEMASLTKSVDDEVVEKDGLLKPKNENNDINNNPNIGVALCRNFCAFTSTYVKYIKLYKPGLFWTLCFFGILIPSILILLDVFDNSTDHFGYISHDYSNINLESNFDHKMKDIDHWCLRGDNNSCRCEDPTTPAPRNEYRRWSNAHAGNVAMIQDMVDQGVTSPDIAFLGGTIIEKMDGRWFGDVTMDGLNKVANIFNKHFGGTGDENEDQSKVMTAAAMGIAADLNQSVLWRIMNGEMPDNFDPKVWWLELGLNDLGRAQCSEEVVVIGVLRIVEEIMKRKPDAVIVINSLFPMADLRGGLAPPTQVDLQKSFGGPPPKGGYPKKPLSGEGFARPPPTPRVGPNGRPLPPAQGPRQPQTGPNGRPLPQNVQDIQGRPKVTNFRPRVFKKGPDGKPLVGQPFPGGRTRFGPDGKPLGGRPLQQPPRGGSSSGSVNNRDNKFYYDREPPKKGGSPPPHNRNLERDRFGRNLRDRVQSGRGGGGVRDRRDNKGYRDKYKTKIGPDADKPGLFKKKDPELIKLGRDDKTKQHVFDPVTRHERKLPLWTSITAINRELRKFTMKNDNVYFFDATSMFTERVGHTYNLKNRLINHIGLPTNRGFEVWETAVANYVRRILDGSV